MKRMNKDTRRLLIAAAVIVVILLITRVGNAQSGSGGDAPSGPLVTLPPVTEPVSAPTAAPQETAVPSVEEPGYTEDYPEDIGYTGGSDDIDEYGTYSGAEDVAYYLHVYGHLPDNYITKDEAEDAGWVSTKGNLWDVAYGVSIGGDRFGNREGLLPKGEKYYECDVNYSGGYRGEERLIFTEDGDVYYTDDHYESFEKLY